MIGITEIYHRDAILGHGSIKGKNHRVPPHVATFAMILTSRTNPRSAGNLDVMSHVETKETTEISDASGDQAYAMGELVESASLTVRTLTGPKEFLIP